jgi:hypothetical protein
VRGKRQHAREVDDHRPLAGDERDVLGGGHAGTSRTSAISSAAVMSCP